MTAEQIAEIIETLSAQYDSEYAWGVRFDNPGLPVGHLFPASREWIDGEPTDEMLGGTCAIEALPSIGYKPSRSVDIEAVRHALVAGYEGVPYIVCGIEGGYQGRMSDNYEMVIAQCEIMAMCD